MKAIYARRGDTFFTHSGTLLGRLIRWGERSKNEAPSWANHTGVVVEDGWIGEPCGGNRITLPAEQVTRDATGIAHAKQAIVIEALWHVRRGPLKLNGTEVRVFRPIPGYEPDELERFVAEAETFVGDKYGWWKLLVQLADKSLFGDRKVLTTTLHIKGRPICSFLGGFVNQMAQGKGRILARLSAHLDQIARGLRDVLRNGQTSYYAFGVAPQACDPDQMMDYCLANPSEWEEMKG